VRDSAPAGATSRSIEQHRHRRLAWALWASALLLALAALTFLILGRTTSPPSESFGFRGFSAVFAIVFGTTGLLIASRVSSNPIGWLLLAIGVGGGVQELAQQYAIYGVLYRPGSVPAADVAAWTTQWIWIPLTAIAIVFIPLLYPTGRLPSPRWRPIAVAAGVLIALDAAAFALAPGPLEEFRAVVNPFGLLGATGLMEIAEFGLLPYMLALVAAVTSLVIRYRRASRDERLQLKWLVLVGALAGVALVATFLMQVIAGSTPRLLEYLIVLTIAAIPAAIGIAILRYRLYDIDVVINRTVAYGVLAAFITGVFVAIVVGVGTAVGSRGNPFLSAVAAAIVALAFQPARRQSQHLANRLVYGDRATPYEVLSGFTGRLAETYSVEDVLPRLARVLADGIGASAVTITLGSGGSAHPVAAFPPSSAGITGGHTFDVRHQGDVLGAINVVMPPSEPLGPSQEKLVATVATQAGLVLRNASLIEDLKASRQRLVAAQNEERRRIERNIHDGAQQQLIALAVKLKMADSLVGKDEERAHAMLADLQTETTQAVEDIRDLARGIYPPLLADKGLGAALESQARKSAVPVSVETGGIGRYPQEAEAAVYFACLEALQNVAKYAEATGATVRLAQANSTLSFEVTDDGRGFDPAGAQHGSGLQGIADRLHALAGELEIESAPGGGTTVRGRIPVKAEEVTR
jgi:signal transduction histidine kinase